MHTSEGWFSWKSLKITGKSNPVPVSLQQGEPLRWNFYDNMHTCWVVYMRNIGISAPVYANLWEFELPKATKFCKVVFLPDFWFFSTLENSNPHKFAYRRALTLISLIRTAQRVDMLPQKIHRKGSPCCKHRRIGFDFPVIFKDFHENHPSCVHCQKHTEI
jgi:hypothetical protein